MPPTESAGPLNAVRTLMPPRVPTYPPSAESYVLSATQAHQHAANADENIAQGLLVPAAEEHRKAAEAFASCIDQSGDENVCPIFFYSLPYSLLIIRIRFQAKRTLRMLHNEHTKAAKELERRIAKLREDGIDPALPQKPTPQRPRATAPQSPAIVTARMPPPTSPSPPPQAHGHGRPGWTRMSESQGVGDESFMVLGGRVSQLFLCLPRDVGTDRRNTMFSPSPIPGMLSINFGRSWRV